MSPRLMEAIIREENLVPTIDGPASVRRGPKTLLPSEFGERSRWKVYGTLTS